MCPCVSNADLILGIQHSVIHYPIHFYKGSAVRDCCQFFFLMLQSIVESCDLLFDFMQSFVLLGGLIVVS